MYAVILAGGSGSRFWPKSREQLPKQLLKITGQGTMIQNTLDRITPVIPPENTWVVTNENYALETCRQLQTMGFCPSQLLTEPMGRNTAAAIGYVASILIKKHPDAIMAVFPADHAITTPEAFCTLLRQAENVAKKDHLVTLGIEPITPETGYGYIKQGQALEGGAFKVNQFIEKPDLVTAEKYLEEGEYYWNSGMFIWKVSTLLHEIERHLPKLHAKLDALTANTVEAKGRHPYRILNESGKKIFISLESISIDYGLMEKSSIAAVLPANIRWNDVGAWTALEDISDKDSQGNVIDGNVVAIDSSESIFQGSERLVAALGLKKIIVVDTPDVTFISTHDKAQEVMSVVKSLEANDRNEGSVHRKVYRPWGWYDSIESGLYFQVKRLHVNPGAKLSLQMHHKRAEHWVVVSGTAIVTNGEDTLTLTKGDSTYIPIGTTHGLENKTNKSLEIIEVQSGSYLGEDDIVRFEDIYGRAES